MSYIKRGQPGYGSATLSLFAGAFITFAVLYTTQPVMPLLSRDYQVSPAAASLSLSAATGALALTMMVVSGVSDRFGRKRVMALSLLLSSLLCLAVAAAPSFALLVVLRVLQGVVLAGFPSIAMTYVSEEFHPASVAPVMGLYVSGTSVGGMVGRLVTGVLTDMYSWRLAIAAIGVIGLVLAVLFWLWLPKPAHFTPQSVRTAEMWRRFVRALRNPALRCMYLLGFLLMGGFVTMYNYISYLLMEPPYGLSQTVVGFLFMVYLTGTVSSAWMGRLAEQWGRGRALRMSVAIALAGCLITLFPTLWMKLVGLCAFTFGFFAAHAVASGWVGQLAHQVRAQASSLYLLFYYAGSSIVGACGGLCWSRLGWPGVVGLIAVLLIMAWLVEMRIHYYLLIQRTN
ncbi:MFS transporter [Alicyclobacillus shizuokensis]|uniref:MFS transporter n=1 Tax=Alicyclobacillus shizuokensis TaxID=392014 RepID=UPI00082C0807|nr:MFS transporter [Alicyclobacillus shizuokensis]MCL6626582.1 MFS transporter [Alicyclobacillus shizuokensis]